MLDLKRMYWNCGVFHWGKRKGRCPYYEHLGPRRPSSDLANLLQEEMSTALAEANAMSKAKTETVAT
jgi:hypothetical protein